MPCCPSCWHGSQPPPPGSFVCSLCALQARKTFQKLIYVSNLVFGDRQAAFLLPWGRVFGLNDAQVGGLRLGSLLGSASTAESH